MQQMNCSRLASRLCLMALLVMPCAVASGESVQADCESSIRLEVSTTGPDGKVFGRFNAGMKDFAGMLRELSLEATKCGSGRPVDVLVGDRLPIATLNDLRGLLSKAGLVKARYYIVSSQSGRMVEILFGSVVAYPDDDHVR